MNILQINASLQGEDGQSTRLAKAVTASLLAEHPRASVTVRDLARSPVPHLDAARFGAFLAKTPDQAQQAVLEFSNALVEELRRADIVVIGLPMYNFGVPSQLKAWIDHVARAGVTFRYTENGPVGLLTGKKAYVAAARGGLYAGTPADTQTTYVRDILRFIGIADVEFVYAEGLNISAESREKGLASARARIAQLLPAAAEPLAA
ncbi:MAG: NAD(P)H-dependent oxidoreductase [Betaproteobacteria bacterium]|nr:NAD(P)H-dependent oxidoreductase [Betaproteobacteria bacterium]